MLNARRLGSFNNRDSFRLAYLIVNCSCLLFAVSCYRYGCSVNEAPKCPVCLDVIDPLSHTQTDHEHSSMITILCGHVFHTRCLSKCSQSHSSTCPVCRYQMQPYGGIGALMSMNIDDLGGVGSSQCFECGSSSQLWLCIICGHVGCGRCAL